MVVWFICCISFDSYIKPQLRKTFMYVSAVVYLLTPTSNHNRNLSKWYNKVLYIFWLLHQTTTSAVSTPWAARLYIFWLLHQTTTSSLASRLLTSCISFDSYIKPQLHTYLKEGNYVVYLLTPTSNHNCLGNKHIKHSLYIFWLLHQTTTKHLNFQNFLGCISFDSYIKPQLIALMIKWYLVVYLLTPTSNHNYYIKRYAQGDVVYLLTPTSNHNL